MLMRCCLVVSHEMLMRCCLAVNSEMLMRCCLVSSLEMLMRYCLVASNEILMICCLVVSHEMLMRCGLVVSHQMLMRCGIVVSPEMLLSCSPPWNVYGMLSFYSHISWVYIENGGFIHNSCTVLLTAMSSSLVDTESDTNNSFFLCSEDGKSRHFVCFGEERIWFDIIVVLLNPRCLPFFSPTSSVFTPGGGGTPI